MNEYVWNVCRRDDQYNVFEEPIPMPEVKTKKEISESGRSMEIMRNNPDFDTLWKDDEKEIYKFKKWRNTAI